jgi:hypothetical protein
MKSRMPATNGPTPIRSAATAGITGFAATMTAAPEALIKAQAEKAVRQWAGQGNPSRSQSAVSRVGAMLPVDGLHAGKLPRVG